MNKHTYIAILVLIPNIILAGDWYAVDNEKLNINEKNIEENLWRYLKGTSSVKFKPRETYTYQYVVTKNEDIYINAFCNTWNRENLYKELLVVEDGGSCYFQVNYNLKTGMFSNLSVNGEA